jgi:hypothetical protein
LAHHELLCLAATARRAVKWKVIAHADYFLAPPRELMEVVTDLAYSGNIDQARRFVVLAWPHNVKGRDAFWHSFMLQLRRSRYYIDLKRLNRM